ncbi:MAG TPA: hypothetical protein PLK30_10955 [Blastocatellia bacterium]|nr:hypothetical protein [Blastocatellia bacterium]
MKQIISAVCGITLWGLILSVVAIAQNQAQDSRLLMLSKNFSGSITQTSIEIALTANADCDQTKTFIPDNSKLVTQSFVLNADSKGVGTFSGSAYIITPEGRIVLQGLLKGTVGINTRCGSNSSCRLPWHLEGLFESAFTTMQRTVSRGGSDAKILPMMLNFSADLNPQTASPLPIYQGRLDGLVPTLPAEVDRITIIQDKTIYQPNDVINATVINESSENIQTWDKRSFCSIFQLQILDGNQWNDTAFCPFKAPSLPVYIPANSKFGVQMHQSQTIEPLKAGTYRLALTFRFVSGEIPLSDSFVVYSPQFKLEPQMPTNQVLVAPGKGAYEEQEQLTLSVNNVTSQTIVAYDHQSYCSIVTVQRNEGGNWVDMFPCLLGSQSNLIKISAGEDRKLKLPADTAPTKLAAGAYRLEFTYWQVDANGNPTGNPTTVFSNTFAVVAKQ